MIENKTMEMLSPYKFSEEFYKKYNLKEKFQTVFILNEDPKYYYFTSSAEFNDVFIIKNGIWVRKEDAMDNLEKNSHFDVNYFIDILNIYRIPKTEMKQYSYRPNELKINWDVQLHFVMQLDKLIQKKVKINIILIDDVKGQFLSFE